MKQPGQTGALPAGQNQARQIFKILGLFDPPVGKLQSLQVFQVFVNAALQIENADNLRLRPDEVYGHGVFYQPRFARICSGGICPISRPGMASPNPSDASRTFCGSLK